jgi:sugar/nucleoside kinase (ribokinase family)
MSLLVTGSIGIDTVEAPSGGVADALGGSGVYFAYAAGFFGPVRLVGVVGGDCPDGFLKPVEDNPAIDTGGVEVRQGSKTFRWHGKYHDDVNTRDTIRVELNVLGERGPTIPENFRDSEYVFLANTHPALQAELLGQLTGPKLVVADTMDLWIETERAVLDELLGRLDGLVLNDSEALGMTGKRNVIQAGREIAEKVKKFCVVKKGEHGSVLFLNPGWHGHAGVAWPCSGTAEDAAANAIVAAPGYPAVEVVDPTGAGDCFAGGMMGYLAAEDRCDGATLRRAIAYGTVVASLELEDFSLRRLQAIARADIDARLDEFLAITRF